MSIRPFVQINQASNMDGGAALLDSEMKGILIGPARQSEREYKDSLVIGSAATVVQQATTSVVVYDVAGITTGADLLPETISFGLKNGSAELQITGTLIGKLKSVTEKHIIVVDTTVVGSATTAAFIGSGAKVGDFLTLSFDNVGTIATFKSKIRTINTATDSIEITLWDEVDIGNDTTDFASVVLKDVVLADVKASSALDIKTIAGNKISFDGTSSANDAFFTTEVYVYSPSANITSETTKVSFTPITNMSDFTEVKSTIKVVDGSLFNTFDASRTDLSNNIIDVNYFNYESILGSGESQANKVAFAMKLLCKEVPGAQMRVYVTEDDTPDSYKKALGFIQSTSLAYSVSVLTDNAEVIDALAVMSREAANPLLAKYKMGFVSPKTPHFNRKMNISAYTITTGAIAGTFEVVATAGGFLSNDIQVGSTVYIESELSKSDAEYYDMAGDSYRNSWTAKITSVITDNRIILEPAIPGTNLITVTSGEDLILGGLSEGVILSELVKKQAMDLKNKRMVSIFPDKFSMETGTEYVQEIIPGYFVAALVNGVAAHLPPQQGLSNLSFKSIKRAIGSSFVFTDSALDDVASAGVFVIIQESLSSDPYVLRQLTTDVSSLDNMEISKVRCLDKATEVFSGNLKDYIGKRNITDANVEDIKNELRIAGISLTSNPLPLLGSVITSYEIVSVEVPANEADAINAVVDVTTPNSLNKIRLNINSK